MGGPERFDNCNGMRRLKAMANRLRRRAEALPIDARQRLNYLETADAIDKAIGRSIKQKITFVDSARERVVAFNVSVVPKLTGGLMEITWEQNADFRNIESKNGGRVTSKEFDALQNVNIEEIFRLAQNDESNLQPLFCWDKGLLDAIHRRKQGHTPG